MDPVFYPSFDVAFWTLRLRDAFFTAAFSAALFAAQILFCASAIRARDSALTGRLPLLLLFVWGTGEFGALTEPVSSPSRRAASARSIEALCFSSWAMMSLNAFAMGTNRIIAQ